MAGEATKTGEIRGGEALAGDLFENFSGEEAGLVADARPFARRAAPIGGSRKGVPNKRTVQMRELYLKSGYPHPLLWGGSLLRMGIDGLAEALSCTLIEAAELLRKVAGDVAPYIEGKQPTRVHVEGDARRPVIVFGETAAALEALRQARDEGAMAIDDDLDIAIEQNQGLRRGEREASQDSASHDDAKPLNGHDNSDGGH